GDRERDGDGVVCIRRAALHRANALENDRDRAVYAFRSRSHGERVVVTLVLADSDVVTAVVAQLNLAGNAAIIRNAVGIEEGIIALKIMLHVGADRDEDAAFSVVNSRIPLVAFL